MHSLSSPWLVIVSVLSLGLSGPPSRGGEPATSCWDGSDGPPIGLQSHVPLTDYVCCTLCLLHTHFAFWVKQAETNVE